MNAMHFVYQFTYHLLILLQVIHLLAQLPNVLIKWKLSPFYR